MRFLTVNLDAILVELDDLAQTQSLLASLQAEPIAGVEEMVPAARTILLRYRPAAVSMEALIANIGQRSLSHVAHSSSTLIEIPVDYTQGEDLDEVAQMLGISRAEIIRRHTGSEYTVAFTGFAPGFAYLSGGHPSLNVPRRQTPRTRIPAGAVGLAGEFSGVYPKASPGGWQIIGVTQVPMWDLTRAVPALLQPGFRVRFVDASGAAAVPLAQTPAAPMHSQDDGPALEVISTGLMALFQDLGRHGLAAQGVSASGAMDPAALRAANRLVGNDHDAACVEIVHGGFQCASRGETVVAITGADSPLQVTSIDGAKWSAPSHQAFALADGDQLHIGAPIKGARSYLAARGGFCVAPVLGSSATDTLAQIGPPVIAKGDRLTLGEAPRRAVGAPELPPADLPGTTDVVTLDLVMGPRSDWFTLDAIELLCQQEWTVTPQSNRVGLRLAGVEALTRSNTAELPSEGTALGAIQVPASGQPVLFLADHPLTGGYPVIASVASHDLDRAGQIPVGARLRFRVIRPFVCIEVPHTRDTP